jgi:hypothetical protein
VGVVVQGRGEGWGRTVGRSGRGTEGQFAGLALKSIPGVLPCGIGLRARQTSGCAKPAVVDIPTKSPA